MSDRSVFASMSSRTPAVCIVMPSFRDHAFAKASCSSSDAYHATRRPALTLWRRLRAVTPCCQCLSAARVIFNVRGLTTIVIVERRGSWCAARCWGHSCCCCRHLGLHRLQRVQEEFPLLVRVGCCLLLLLQQEGSLSLRLGSLLLPFALSFSCCCLLSLQQEGALLLRLGLEILHPGHQRRALLRRLAVARVHGAQDLRPLLLRGCAAGLLGFGLWWRWRRRRGDKTLEESAASIENGSGPVAVRLVGALKVLFDQGSLSRRLKEEGGKRNR